MIETNNNNIVMLSQINKKLENNEQYVYIDDTEIEQAMYNYRRGQLLQDEADRLKENAKEVFKSKLCPKNIKYAYNKDFILTLTNFISNRFGTERFKKDHPDLYNEYIKPIPSLRVNLDNYQK